MGGDRPSFPSHGRGKGATQGLREEDFEFEQVVQHSTACRVVNRDEEAKACVCSKTSCVGWVGVSVDGHCRVSVWLRACDFPSRAISTPIAQKKQRELIKGCGEIEETKRRVLGQSTKIPNHRHGLRLDVADAKEVC